MTVITTIPTEDNVNGITLHYTFVNIHDKVTLPLTVLQSRETSSSTRFCVVPPCLEHANRRKCPGSYYIGAPVSEICPGTVREQHLIPCPGISNYFTSTH